MRHGARADFIDAQLVPDLLQRFNPDGTLGVSFSGNAIEIGQLLAQDGKYNWRFDRRQLIVSRQYSPRAYPLCWIRC